MSSLATARAPPGGCPNVMPPDSWLTYVPVFRSPMCPVCTPEATSCSAHSTWQVVFLCSLSLDTKRPRFPAGPDSLLTSKLPILIVAAPDYAARVAASWSASGTGPQMYAEKSGVGSVLSPLEMMMPRGSDDTISLRSFFILTLSIGFTMGFERFIGTRHATWQCWCNSL